MAKITISTGTNIDSVSGYARISKNGNSLNLNLTSELKLINAGYGEYVKFTVEKLDN